MTTQPKHTPGPLFAGALESGTIVHDSPYGTIAYRLYPASGDEGRKSERTQADAILYAAAPDLLEACKRLLHEITTDDARRELTRRYGDAHWMQSVETARAAIARATGEVQS